EDKCVIIGVDTGYLPSSRQHQNITNKNFFLQAN
ncbi:MAG: hypothetical protein ACJA04_000908, partial [Cellvibrionaceae bacterium]